MKRREKVRSCEAKVGRGGGGRLLGGGVVEREGVLCGE